MTISVVVRPMEDHDIAAVADLSGEFGYPTTPERTAANFDRIRRVSTVHPTEILVAESVLDHTVVGWVHVCIPADLVKSGVAEICGLVVSSAHRGSGYGRALMHAAESSAVAHGCTEIRLRSGSHRTEAHAFYQRLGYRVAKEQTVFTKGMEATPTDR